ncbi:hypothetical protein FACS1894163_08680 [Spirochaetia bacterium]|nr:hypothetical protein FACS1894163_08680 [Spirochaetia bacterium]
MSPMLNGAVRAVCAVLLFVTVYTFFFVTHRPPTRARRRALLILIAVYSFGVAIIMHRLFIDGKMSIEMFYVITIAGDVLSALLCGNLPRSMITVIYFNVISAYIDYLLQFYGVAFSAGGNLQDAFPFIPPTIIGGLLFVLLAVFYSRISRKYPAKLTLRSWILAALPPLINVCVLVYFWEVAEEFQKSGTNIYGIGFVVGIFLFLSNCFLFYWHISILASRQAEETLEKLRKEAPPGKPDTGTPFDSGELRERVWTPQEGFIDAFAVRYKFSLREKQVLELVLSGKSDKEIAAEINIAVSTVSSYLQRLYRKTGVSGRFGLLTFLHIGNPPQALT